MSFSRMACDIQRNVQLVRFMHIRKREMTSEKCKVQTNGDSSQELAALFFLGPI